MQAERTHPKASAPDAAQNLTVVLELQKQLQETRDVAAEKEKELALQVAQLRNTCTLLEARLLDNDDSRNRVRDHKRKLLPSCLSLSVREQCPCLCAHKVLQLTGHEPGKNCNVSWECRLRSELQGQRQRWRP